MATFVLPLARGAHRKAPRVTLTATLVLTGATVIVAGLTFALLAAMLVPKPACRTVPMHVGWPNSHCRETWAKWKQP